MDQVHGICLRDSFNLTVLKLIIFLNENNN